jgi:hypothetical protein
MVTTRLILTCRLSLILLVLDASCEPHSISPPPPSVCFGRNGTSDGRSELCQMLVTRNQMRIFPSLSSLGHTICCLFVETLSLEDPHSFLTLFQSKLEFLSKM